MPASPTSPLRLAYLHGFASGPESRKGVALAATFEERHGVTLARPDLNQPSFERLTFTAALEAISAWAGDGPAPVGLIGSSMGGYLAARWAELHPERVDRVLLLCPGFGMTRRWPQLVGADGMARWRAHGQLRFPHGDETLPLHWGFIEDALTHPDAPVTPCPTLIMHGVNDETVAIAESRAYTAAHAHVTLTELNDDHGLIASLPAITEAAERFFGLTAAA